MQRGSSEELEKRIEDLEKEFIRLKNEFELYKWRVGKAFGCFLIESTNPQEFLEGSRDREKDISIGNKFRSISYEDTKH